MTINYTFRENLYHHQQCYGTQKIYKPENSISSNVLRSIIIFRHGGVLSYRVTNNTECLNANIKLDFLIKWFMQVHDVSELLSYEASS